MKVLNLYAGIGGNRKLWTGVDVTAVEYNREIAKVYQDNFPNDTMIIGDAKEYLLYNYQDYDFIWASPPCQSHSRMVKATRHDVRKYPDMSLYQIIIYLTEFFKGRWVVENVKPYYDPLIKPTKVLGRHYFWSNFNLPNVKTPSMSNFIKADSKEEIEKFKEWLGIYYHGNIYVEGNHSPGTVLRNCVHPKVGKSILNQAMNVIINDDDTQQTLF